jgi:hypothetical protein
VTVPLSPGSKLCLSIVLSLRCPQDSIFHDSSPPLSQFVGEDPLEVSPLSGEAKSEPLSGSLQTGLRFFQHPLPAVYCAAFTVGLLSGLRERIGLTVFRVFDLRLT